MVLRAKRPTFERNRKRPIGHTGFASCLARFLEYAAVKGYSTATLVAYEAHVRRFAAWAWSDGVRAPEHVDPASIQRYQAHLYHYRKTDGQPLSLSSQVTIISALRPFFRWLHRTGEIASNPTRELELPRVPKTLPRTILNVQQIIGILKQPDVTTVTGIRDRAVLECLYATGIRRSEAANLRVFDVHLERAVLSVRAGKWRKDRMLPITPRLARWIGQYITEARDELCGPNDQGRLFLTDYGEPFPPASLAHRVKHYIKQAGIECYGSCHVFRHAVATHMLDNGADIRYIQELLGHEDLTSTQIYTHVSIERLKAVHLSTHPLSD